MVLLPVADDGEGTVQSLVDATDGEIKELTVSGPLGVSVDAFYGVLGDGSSTAVIEMAAASGLHHVPMPQRDPKITSSYGTGELILAALNGGAKRLIIGLGGSATNDAGVGMMAALGVKFLDDQQCRISPCGGDIKRLASVDISELDPRLQSTEILVACDVDNPLCGPDGATYTFGPQKGGRGDDLQSLDDALLHFANIVQRDLGRSVMDIAGGGAAGGMAAAFMAFTDATIKPGIDMKKFDEIFKGINEGNSEKLESLVLELYNDVRYFSQSVIANKDSLDLDIYKNGGSGEYRLSCKNKIREWVGGR